MKVRRTSTGAPGKVVSKRANGVWVLFKGRKQPTFMYNSQVYKDKSGCAVMVLALACLPVLALVGGVYLAA